MKAKFLKKRINSIDRFIKKNNSSTIVIVETAPENVRSGSSDLYLQDSDFFYLTGSKLHKAVLLFSNKADKATLICKRPDQHTKVWEGEGENPEALARKLSVKLEYVDSKLFLKHLLEKVKHHKRVYCNPFPGTESHTLNDYVNSLNELDRYLLPRDFCSSRELVSQFRLIKDSEEVKLIKEAINVTGASLESLQDKIKSGAKEHDLAAFLEYQFKINGASGLAFPTIMASGKNAAILHYTDNSSRLKSGESLLIDCGAKYQGYSADISRCYPVDGEYKGIYAEIYDIVLDAQHAAIKKVKHNASIKSVQMAAIKELTIGLQELGVLKGKTSKLIKDKKYLPYTIHGIGHSLGLDTHDPGGHREGLASKLQKGMVFTVEPGLYFSKKTRRIPAGGIRIEDDVLVRTKDCQILSSKIEK